MQIKEMAAAEELKTVVMTQKVKLEAQCENLQARWERLRDDRLKEGEEHKTLVDDLSQKVTVFLFNYFSFVRVEKK